MCCQCAVTVLSMCCDGDCLRAVTVMCCACDCAVTMLVLLYFNFPALPFLFFVLIFIWSLRFSYDFARSFLLFWFCWCSLFFAAVVNSFLNTGIERFFSIGVICWQAGCTVKLCWDQWIYTWKKIWSSSCKDVCTRSFCLPHCAAFKVYTVNLGCRVSGWIGRPCKTSAAFILSPV